jgi:uncharacterized protein
MQQQLGVVTVGVADLVRSRNFYTAGFGWVPVFENPEIIFYQMHGLMFGTFHKAAMQDEMCRASLASPGALILTHIVAQKDAVQVTIDRLAAAGGRILRNADEPPYGGFRGYVADPDDHSWEIAWNAAWPTDARGSVTFAI